MRHPEHPCIPCGKPTTNEISCSPDCALRARVRNNLPLQPLLRYVAPRLYAVDLSLPYAESVTARAARVLGVSQRQVLRLSESGLRPHVADAICTRLGFNPIEVWGIDWYAPADRGGPNKSHTPAV